MVPSNPHPPRFASIILRWFCKPRLVEEIEGDLEEYYLIYIKRYPLWKARFFYWFHLMSFLRPYSLKNKLKNSKYWIMLNNYFKFSLRYFTKHRTNALLNVLSLSVGIACFLFIFIYLDGELSYDEYHTDADRIKRVAIDFVHDNGDRLPDATTPPALAPALQSEFPEVEVATRIFPTWGSKYLMGASQDLQFYEEAVYRVDSTFFDVFSYNVIAGDKETMLDDISSIVLTKSMAEKYFGGENPLGREITFFNRDNQKMIVSGIIEDVPYNSHFSFDFLTRLHITSRNIDEDWGWYNYYTYVKLNDGSDAQAFEEKLQPLYLRNNPTDTITPNITYSQPLTDIHLKSALKWELGTNSNMSNVRIFFSIGLFILIISIMNYLNLTIGGLVRRIKEVGVRKSFGASKGNLIGQFVVESVLMMLVSLIIGSLLAELAFSQMNELFQRDISILDAENLKTIGVLTTAVIGLGLLAGLYPALHFASMGEVKAMLNKKKNKALDVKQILLVAQFSISAIMIVGTMVVYQQLNYFKNSDMGFNMDQVLVIQNADQVSNQETLKNRIKDLAFVQEAGASNGVVGGLNWTFSVGYPEQFLMNYASITPDYLETMGFQFVAGRNFDPSIESESQGLNFVVNEEGLRALKLTLDQVGESVPMISNRNDSLIYGKVIGVVKNFHYTNFRSVIKPYSFFYRDRNHDYLTVRMNTSNLKENIEEIENLWADMAPGVPFESYFLDQSFAQLHEKEEKLSDVMLYLTALSIFISFIGMFAIANIVIKSRLKEVAVRKALGASVNQVVNLFTKNFMILVLIANVIGLPIAYFTMQEWLADFSYRMVLSPVLFIVALLSTVALAYLIVGSRSLRAATSDLTERLRDE